MKEDDFLHKINSHKGILYKVSRMYFDNLDDQQDLFQEIVLQLWKSASTFKGDSKFSSWMYRVALNTALAFFKKEKRKPDAYKVMTYESIAPEDGIDQKEQQLEHFYRATKELNRIEKALILLFIEGYSGKEIAKNLGITEANVRVKTNRTKKKLKGIIKKQGYEF